ncbi:MAG TPA: TetR/AcrR family transcriptional regulator [Ktedonobacterales bacterium]|jgi:AcrR family transcriptional regulator
MPRSPQQNQRIKDERRRQILDAALKVFAAKGLAATMMSDIAAASDLSYGLIYHYFHDKEELFLTLVERALQGAWRLSEEILTQPGTPWERLYLLCAGMLEGTRSTPEYFRIIVQAQLSEAPSSAVRGLMHQYGDPFWNNITILIQQGQEAGQVVAGDAHELANVLNAIIQGLSLDLAYDNTDLSAGRAAFPSVETVMRFLRPDLFAHITE